jgi:hypothetical protein
MSVWVSTDAVHWAVTLSAGDSYRGLLNGANLVVIADHRACPTDPQDHPRVWVSSDAHTWKEAGDTGLPSGQSVVALGVGGGEYVLGGTAGSTSTLWDSTDGSHWSRVHLDPNVFPPVPARSPLVSCFRLGLVRSSSAGSPSIPTTARPTSRWLGCGLRPRPEPSSLPGVAHGVGQPRR